jgi:hypothetical protein
MASRKPKQIVARKLREQVVSSDEDENNLNDEPKSDDDDDDAVPSDLESVDKNE